MFNEDKFKNELNELAKNHSGSNPQWSIEIKKILSKFFNEMVPNQNYKTCANGLGALREKEWEYVDYDNEYLYDLTIFQEKTSEIEIPFIIKTLLVAECEWGKTKEVIDDFQKLLLSNAEYKVMVFEESPLKISIESIFIYMSQNIKNYSGINGTFIIACFRNFEKGFKIEIINN